MNFFFLSLDLSFFCLDPHYDLFLFFGFVSPLMLIKWPFFFSSQWSPKMPSAVAMSLFIHTRCSANSGFAALGAAARPGQARSRQILLAAESADCYKEGRSFVCNLVCLTCCIQGLLKAPPALNDPNDPATSQLWPRNTSTQ